jgi:hypothetical protein
MIFESLRYCLLQWTRYILTRSDLQKHEHGTEIAGLFHAGASRIVFTRCNPLLFVFLKQIFCRYCHQLGVVPILPADSGESPINV